MAVVWKSMIMGRGCRIRNWEFGIQLIHWSKSQEDGLRIITHVITQPGLLIWMEWKDLMQVKAAEWPLNAVRLTLVHTIR